MVISGVAAPDCGLILKCLQAAVCDPIVNWYGILSRTLATTLPGLNSPRFAIGICFSLISTFSFSSRSNSSGLASSTLMNSTAASANCLRFATLGTRYTLNEYLVLLNVDVGNHERNLSTKSVTVWAAAEASLPAALRFSVGTNPEN